MSDFLKKRHGTLEWPLILCRGVSTSGVCFLLSVVLYVVWLMQQLVDLLSTEQNKS